MTRPLWAALGLVAFASVLAVPRASRAAYAPKETATFPVGADTAPAELQDIDVVENLGGRVPTGLLFRDPAGKPVAFDALLARGRPLLVTLGYYRCPMLCNLMLEGLAKAVKEAGLKLGEDFHAVTVSIDPDEDPKLAADTQRRVLANVGAGARPEDWPFLVGDAAASRALADRIGFRYKYDPQSKQFAHSAVAFVFTADGKVSRYLYGVEFSARDLKLALVEAGQGRVGTSLDRVLLSCFRYDPMARRYVPYALAFVRFGALTVLAALVAVLAILWRKEISMKKRRTA